VPVGTGTVVEYVFTTEAEGQYCINGLTYYTATNTLLTSNLTAALTSIGNLVRPAILACMSLDGSLISEKLLVVSNNTTQGVTSVAAAGAAGSRPTLHEPLTVAAIINKHSTLKGQHGRGRMAVACISSSDCTNSYITVAAEKTALTSLCTAMYATGTDGTNTYYPCIATRATISPRLVTNYTLMTPPTPNFLLGTVRRRKIGRGK